MSSSVTTVSRLIGASLAALAIIASTVNAQSPHRRIVEQLRPAFPSLDLGTTTTSGQAAISRLGARLQDVASWYGKSAAELRSQLLSDRRLRVDRGGRLFAVEELEAPVQTATSSSAQDSIQQGALMGLDQTFMLHSRPGADRTIYLDFNGATVSGTAWTANGSTITAKAFDIDGSANSFSDAELQRIQYIWQRVAEDYAPFDVDVTTQPPAADRVTRTDSGDQSFGTTVVVTDNTGVYSCSCGGIAYIGVFNSTAERYKPAFVFYNMLGSGNEKAVAEAISHEAGHNIGLSHDGTSSTAYYAGQGTDAVTGWAPIMGVGYYKPLVQFSKGEYAGANNKEDDFAVAQSFGLPLRRDDAGDTVQAAAKLQAAAGGTGAVIEGVIEAATDRDVYGIASGAGVLTASVSPASRSANADLVLTLLDANGQVLSTANPVNALTANLTFNVPTQGNYFLEVRTTGQGDAATTGYSAYGAVGNYRLAVSSTAPSGSVPSPALLANVTSGTGPLAVSFDGSPSSDDGRIAFWYWDFGDGSSDQTGTLSSVTHVYQAPGSYLARLTVVDDSGLSATTTQEISVLAPVLQPSAQVISMALKTNRRGLSATAVVTVLNASGKPVRGARVAASWSGASNKLLSRTSSAAGKASFASPIASSGGCFTITVTSITAPGLSFGTGSLPSAQICS